MRVIPKKTKVRMELFRGIELPDVLIGAVGLALTVSLFVSNVPLAQVWASMAAVITTMLIIPVEDDKGYLMLYYILRYLSRQRVFFSKSSDMKKRFSVEDITSFTGVNEEFIEYGRQYAGVVIEIPSVEFKFYSENAQNSLIDYCFGTVLRTATMGEVINLVKLDRPVIYDDFIVGERKKIEDLKEAYLNGMISEEELTIRVGIVNDRITQLADFNFKDKVFVPMHYLVFIDKDRKTIMEQAKTAIDIFSSNGMECKMLKGAELAIFLKYNYGHNFDEREAYELQPDKYLDWILPKKIEIAKRTVKYDDLITHNFRVRDYPLMVGNAWGANFMNKVGTKIIMKMTPVDRYKAIRQIDRSIDELREQRANTGKTSRMMELDTHVNTLSDVLSYLQGENEMLFSVNTFIQVHDYDHSALLKRGGEKSGSRSAMKKTVRRELSEEGIRITDLFLQQFEGITSLQPSGFDAFKSYQRGIHSNSIAAVFPFAYKSLCDARGIYVGESGGVPTFVNFFKRDKERVNSNTVIIGKSGSGKSYATKSILTQLAAENSRIFILDPENEYTELARKLSGKIIDVGSATQGRLNPFHIITGLSDDEEGVGVKDNSFTTHLQFLEEFYRQILIGISSDALEYLNNITVRMYAEKGIDVDTDLSPLGTKDYPTFDDLYAMIEKEYKEANGEYSKNNLRILINYISKFAKGGRDSILWNGETSLSTKENFIVFDFQSLLANKNHTTANAQMLLVLKWLDNEIIKNRDYNIKYKAERKIVIVIDEAHVFIDQKYPIALDFMYQLAKRIRKYNGMQVVITQNIKDFVGTEELSRKSTAIINASQYSFIFALAPNDMQDLVKLYENAGTINESEQENIVNAGRGTAFVITTPTERTNMEIKAGEGVEELFNM